MYARLFLEVYYAAQGAGSLRVQGTFIFLNFGDTLKIAFFLILGACLQWCNETSFQGKQSQKKDIKNKK